MAEETKSRGWALILGASSGFGEACGLALAEAGWNIFGIHLDRRGAMPHVEEIGQKIVGFGRRHRFFNINAADDEKRAEVIRAIREELSTAPPSARISLLLHSLAFATLKPFLGTTREASMTRANLEMTLDVMANSLLYWTQDVYFNGLFTDGARIYAMTSAGDHLVWPSYGATSAAKCALEAHLRQIAVELAPKNISANAIRAGVTDTPALRKIPGHDEMIRRVMAVHPAKRLTTPEDVAGVLVALACGKTNWMSGTVIGVDGTEDIAGAG